MQAYEQALETDLEVSIPADDLQHVRHRRASMLWELGHREQALAAYDELLAENPSDPANVYSRGIVLQSLGRTREAEAAYQETLELDPTFYKASLGLGLIYAAVGLPEPARAELTLARRGAGRNHDHHSLRIAEETLRTLG